MDLWGIFLWVGIAALIHTEIIKRRYPKPVHVIMRKTVWPLLPAGALSGSLIGALVMSIFQQDHLIATTLQLGWIPGILIFRWWPWMEFQLNMSHQAANRELEEMKVAEQPTQNSSFNDPSSFGSDAEFNYERSAFTDKQASSDNAAYGWDKQHPADAKFWAIVNDPNASEGERENALKAIFKAQRLRKGQAGRELSTRQ